MSNSQLSPALVAALALTAKHVEAEALLAPVKVSGLLPPSARVKASPISFHSKKVIHNRNRNKLAAKSRKRNRR